MTRVMFKFPAHRLRMGIAQSAADFATVDDLRDFVWRCHPEDGEFEYFERRVQAWGRGSVYVTMTPEECYGWGIAPMKEHLSMGRLFE